MARNIKKGREVVSCGCCVVRKTTSGPQILLVNSGFNKFWGIPKGHREKDELNIECAIRETLEETGIKILVLEEDALPTVSTFLKNGDHKTLFSFFAIEWPINQEIMGDGENEQIAFFSLDKLPKITRWQLPIINKVVEMLTLDNELEQEAH